MAAFGQLSRRLGKFIVRRERTAPAAGVAAVLPSYEVGGQVDIGLVDLLLTGRLGPTRTRLMLQLWADVQGGR